MTTDEALKIVTEVLSQVKANLKEHQLMQQAVDVLRKAAVGEVK